MGCAGRRWKALQAVFRALENVLGCVSSVAGRPLDPARGSASNFQCRFTAFRGAFFSIDLPEYFE